jgi:hypothetical protein
MILIVADSDLNFIGQLTDVGELGMEDFRVPSQIFHAVNMAVYISDSKQFSVILKSRMTPHIGLVANELVAEIMRANQ